jgi:multiple antibiotic resistance protein
MLNIFIAWITFVLSGYIMRVMGRGGLRAVSRVFSLLLAALAVNMVIRGLEMIGVLPVATV